MAYISITVWRDLTDGHLYREGEKFPFDGREIPQQRLDELESGHNRAGLRLISATEAQADQEEDRTEDAPERPAEARKTAAEEKPARTRSRKTK
jgi:hypothetical protein